MLHLRCFCANLRHAPHTNFTFCKLGSTVWVKTPHFSNPTFHKRLYDLRRRTNVSGIPGDINIHRVQKILKIQIRSLEGVIHQVKQETSLPPLGPQDHLAAAVRTCNNTKRLAGEKNTAWVYTAANSNVSSFTQ